MDAITYEINKTLQYIDEADIAYRKKQQELQKFLEEVCERYNVEYIILYKLRAQSWKCKMCRQNFLEKIRLLIIECLAFTKKRMLALYFLTDPIRIDCMDDYIDYMDNSSDTSSYDLFYKRPFRVTILMILTVMFGATFSQIKNSKEVKSQVENLEEVRTESESIILKYALFFESLRKDAKNQEISLKITMLEKKVKQIPEERLNGSRLENYYLPELYGMIKMQCDLPINKKKDKEILEAIDAVEKVVDAILNSVQTEKELILDVNLNVLKQMAQNDSVSINASYVTSKAIQSLPKLESKQVAQAYSIDDTLDIMEGDWVELCERKRREGKGLFFD